MATQPPVRTPEQRAADLEKGTRLRKLRADVKARVKNGTTSLPDVIKDGATDEVVGKIPVLALLESVPGVGKVTALKVMAELGIAQGRRVRGLGPNQRAALAERYAA